MKRRSRIPHLPRPHAARFAQVAIIVLGVYLLLLFAVAIVATRFVVRAQDRFLPDYLELVGRAISDPPRDYFYSLPFITDPETGELSDELLDYWSSFSDWENLSDSLEGASGEAFIKSAHLLTPDGEVILKPDGEIATGVDRGIFLETEPEAIVQASRGQTFSGTREGIRFVYMPVYNRGGSIVALLRLESSERPNVRVERLRSRLAIGFLVAAAILVLLYYATIRLVRRTLEAERAAAQADRLRALGTMTAGIAHEIRNPLGILILQVEELKALVGDLADPKHRKQLGEIAGELEDDARRLKELTEQFLHFSQVKPALNRKTQRVDAAAVVRNLTKLWGKGVRPERREVVVSIPDEPCWVDFGEDSLRQILLNLLRNADEAIGNEHGRIEVGIRVGEMVEIWVEDDGPGIEPSVSNQLFDPFFTTRAEGTGLGLSLSRNLAEAAGGELSVESELEKGARFILSLPRSKNTDIT